MAWSREQTIAYAARGELSRLWRQILNRQDLVGAHTVVALWLLEPATAVFRCFAVAGPDGTSELLPDAFEDRYLRFAGAAHYGLAASAQQAICLPTLQESTRSVGLVNDHRRGMSIRGPLFVSPISVAGERAQLPAVLYAGLAKGAPDALIDACRVHQVALTEAVKEVADGIADGIKGLRKKNLSQLKKNMEPVQAEKDEWTTLTQSWIRGRGLGLGLIYHFPVLEGRLTRHSPPTVDDQFICGMWVRRLSRLMFAAADESLERPLDFPDWPNALKYPVELVSTSQPSAEGLARRPTLHTLTVHSGYVRIGIPSRKNHLEAILSVNIGSKKPSADQIKALSAILQNAECLRWLGDILEELRSWRSRGQQVSAATDFAADLLRKFVWWFTTEEMAQRAHAASAISELLGLMEQVFAGNILAACYRLRHAVKDRTTLDRVANAIQEMRPTVVSGWVVDWLGFQMDTGPAGQDWIKASEPTWDTHSDLMGWILQHRSAAQPFVQLIRALKSLATPVNEHTFGVSAPITTLPQMDPDSPSLPACFLAARNIGHVFGPCSSRLPFPYRSISLAWSLADQDREEDVEYYVILSTCEQEELDLAALYRWVSADGPAPPGQHLGTRWLRRPEAHEIVGAYPTSRLSEHTHYAHSQLLTHIWGSSPGKHLKAPSRWSLRPQTIKLSDVIARNRLRPPFLTLAKAAQDPARATPLDEVARQGARQIFGDWLKDLNDEQLLDAVEPYCRVLCEVLCGVHFDRPAQDEFGSLRHLSEANPTVSGISALARHALIHSVFHEHGVLGIAVHLSAFGELPYLNHQQRLSPFREGEPLREWIEGTMHAQGLSLCRQRAGLLPMEPQLREVLERVCQRQHLSCRWVCAHWIHEAHADITPSDLHRHIRQERSAICALEGEHTCIPHPGWWYAPDPLHNARLLGAAWVQGEKLGLLKPEDRQETSERGLIVDSLGERWNDCVNQIKGFAWASDANNPQRQKLLRVALAMEALSLVSRSARTECSEIDEVTLYAFGLKTANLRQTIRRQWPNNEKEGKPQNPFQNRNIGLTSLPR